jgi:hypothetical protein
MTTIQIIHHLIDLFNNCPRVHWSLIGFYRKQQPGMPDWWYPEYVRDMIGDYPRAMQRCVNSFHGGWKATSQTWRVCP